MRNIIGYIFSTISVIIFAVTGPWAIYLELKILIYIAGFWGLVIGITVLPLTFIAIPWYAGISMGDWFPFLLTFGGGISALIFLAIGLFLFEE